MSRPTHTILPTPETHDATRPDDVNRLRALQRFGQSVWLDYLRHSWRANVLFVDGHVESVVLSEEGCGAVGLCNGIYD